MTSYSRFVIGRGSKVFKKIFYFMKISPKATVPVAPTYRGGWHVKRPHAHVAHGLVLSLGGLYIKKEEEGELKAKRFSFT